MTNMLYRFSWCYKLCFVIYFKTSEDVLAFITTSSCPIILNNNAK